MAHIPVRMCVACRTMKPQHELIRIVNSENGIMIDKSKKLFGRGAYICRCADCVNIAAKINMLARHFKCNVDAAIYADAEGLLDG